MLEQVAKIVFSLALTAQASISPIIYENPQNEAVLAELTAYNSETEQTDDTPWLTAAMTIPNTSTIACPARYPFKTQVKIGDKTYICLDRMNSRFRDGNFFDIWVETKEEALTFGRQQKVVEIVYDPRTTR